jgi:hypothetical protein
MNPKRKELMMKNLQWWMRIVGGLYILNGFMLLPFMTIGRLHAQYIGLDVPVESVAARALTDMWFMFGTETAVIGVMLILASRNPLQNMVLVQTVLLLELLRGVVQDLYWLTRGYYDNAFYVGFIIVHLIVIITGLIFSRQQSTQLKEASAT